MSTFSTNVHFWVKYSFNFATTIGPALCYQVNLPKSSWKVMKCLGKTIILKACSLWSQIKNELCCSLALLTVIIKFHSLSEALSVLNRIVRCNLFWMKMWREYYMPYPNVWLSTCDIPQSHPNPAANLLCWRISLIIRFCKTFPL